MRADDDPEDLFDLLVSETDASMRELFGLLPEPSDSMSEVEKQSYSEEVGRISEVQKNLSSLQLDLWQNCNVAARGTVGDGNCGVEMLVGFTESVSFVPGSKAAREDVLKIIVSYRRELAEMWRSVSSDEFWQRVWQRFVGSRMNLGPWKADARSSQTAPAPTTPVKRRAREPAKTTPEKAFARNRILSQAEAEPEITDVVAAVPPDGDQPANKKKRTGKPREAAATINFDNYLTNFLAEKGLTYRKWIQVHQKDHMLPYPGW